MINNYIQFIIVAFHPEHKAFRELLLHISPYPVKVIDNGGVGEIGITNVDVIRSPSNLGYGGAANMGIRKALGEGAEWVVVMNHNIVASPKFISSLVNKLKNTSSGVAGPILGRLDPVRWTTILDGKNIGTTYISGSVMAIHKQVIDRVGYFYAPYFLYYEEVDFCVKARAHGFPLTQLPSAGLSHEESQTFGPGSITHEYYLARNHLLFIQRCAPWRVKFHEWARLPKTIWEHKKNQNRGALKGIGDYIFRRFGAL